MVIVVTDKHVSEHIDVINKQASGVAAQILPNSSGKSDGAKLDAFDMSILQAKALFCYSEYHKALTKRGKSERTIRYRIQRLKQQGLVNRHGELTNQGKEIIAGVQTLPQGGLVSSHHFWFKCEVFNKGRDITGRGWAVRNFRSYVGNQLLRRDFGCLLHLVGPTLMLCVESTVVGDSPLRNELEAFSVVRRAVDSLKLEGWRVSDPVQFKESHHVFEFLKPFAERVYDQVGFTKVLGVLVDNSCRDGGEFEVYGAGRAESLLSFLARAPDFEREVRGFMGRFDEGKVADLVSGKQLRLEVFTGREVCATK